MTPLLPATCYVVSPRGFTGEQIVVRHDLTLLPSTNQVLVAVTEIVVNYVRNLKRKAAAQRMKVKYAYEVTKDEITRTDRGVVRIITVRITFE